MERLVFIGGRLEYRPYKPNYELIEGNDLLQNNVTENPLRIDFKSPNDDAWRADKSQLIISTLTEYGMFTLLSPSAHTLQQLNNTLKKCTYLRGA